MEGINALIKTKSKFNNSIISPSKQKKLNELEVLYKNNPNKNDDEICILLYGTILRKRSFYSLKFRLMDRLMNDVILSGGDISNLNNVSNAIQVVVKYYSTALILHKNHERQTSVYLMEKCLDLSIKYSLTEYAIGSLKILINHYAFIQVNKTKMNHYIKLRKKYIEIYQQEAVVLEYNALISFLYVTKSGGFSNSELLEVKKMVEHLKKIKSKYTSNTILTHSYDLIFFYYDYIKKYDLALSTAQEALDVFYKMKTKELLGIFSAQNNIAISYFNLKEYNKASEWFEKQLSIVTNGARTWFHTTSLYFLNLMYAKEYDMLLQISISVLSNKNLKKFILFSEQWYIREAFIHLLFMVCPEKFKKEEVAKLRPFSANKFVNEITFYSKDKEGLNISILVVQFLYLLSQKKYNQIFDKVDALKQYHFRYLRNDNTFRSSCFIKMILEMIKADFNPIRTERYAEPYYKKLIKSNIITDERNTRIEIIPYEDLWSIAIEILHQNSKELH